MNEMIEQITLDMLTKDAVSIKRQRYINVDGTEYPIGEPWRRAYTNTHSGRQQVMEEVSEPYRAAIFAAWGDEPTVSDSVLDPISEESEETEDEEGEGTVE